MNVQNNVNFTGLYKNSSTLINSENLKKLANIYTERKPVIRKLEKELKTDLFLSEDMDKVSFSHKKYGKLEKYGMEEMPVSELKSENQSIESNLKTAIENAENDWVRMNYKGMLGIPRS